MRGMEPRHKRGSSLMTISNRIMHKLILIFLMLGSAVGLSAQTKFTDQLQKSAAGQGKVTLHQSQKISDLVNGDASIGSAATKGKSAEGTVKKPQDGDQVEVSVMQPNTGQKVRMNGYRIQVYSGGNSRKAKTEATAMGQRVRNMFGELSIYTNFISPHWICRVGDFKSYEEANEVFREMKATGNFSEAVIVKSKIITYY